MECADARPLLLARRRGRLDAAKAKELEAHLATCADCRAEDDADTELDRAFARLPETRAPARLREALAAKYAPAEAPKRSSTQTSRTRARVLVGATLVAAAIVLVFLLRATGAPDTMTSEAVNDHLRVLYAERPVEIASGGLHQVKPWFSGRVDFAPIVSFEGDADFPLEGGSVGYFVDRKAAIFVYKRRLHTISVLVFRADGLAWPLATTAVGHARGTVGEQRGFHSVIWRDGDLGYAAVSDLNAKELLELASKIAGP